MSHSAKKPSSPSPSPLTVWQVDAFTDRPFRGNPAAVCALPEAAAADWMQRLAAEMNLSETAFLLPRPDDPPGSFDLRWFTPTVEVDLCGHATLASAHVVWEAGLVKAGPWQDSSRGGEGDLAFHTASGVLGASRRQEGWIELDFPAERPEPWDRCPVEEVARALGLEGSRVRTLAANRLDLLVEVDGPGVVEGMAPEAARVAELPVRGVIVTASGSGSELEGADFVSRYFAPRCGVPEDPVTGSAHCALGPWWAERLGRGELVGYQASARGGVVRVRVDRGGERVRLGGRAVTVFEGRLTDPTGP